MANFILSAFADEASPLFSQQLQALKEEGISLIELRGVGDKNCSQLTLQEADDLRLTMDAQGIKLSALGSPYGKAPIDQPFEDHLALFRHGLKLCQHLGCDRIRMFSFFIPAGSDPALWREEVIRRLSIMLEDAHKAGIHLVHENEKGIYGDTDDRCMDLLSHFQDRMGFAFDPANFIQCGVQPLPAYEKLRSRITYFHIKDALFADGSVVSAGHGDGQVAQLLSRVNNERAGDVILTVEPHLTVFSGLANLQSEELTHHETYPDSRTAFHAAVTALKDILINL